MKVCKLLLALTGLAGLVSLAVVIAFVAITGRLMTVQSDSMAPLLRKGDAVIIDRRKETPKIGEVVSYRANNQMVISHRVVAYGTGGVLFTKGDASDRVDTPVKMNQLAGTVTTLLPGAGKLLDTIRTPQALALLVYLPAAIIAANEMRLLGHRRIRPTYQINTGRCW